MDLKEKILATRAASVIEARVPGVDEPVYVRGMTVADANTLFAASPDGKHPNLMAMVLVRCLCDAAGERLFADADAEALGQLPVTALKPLAEIAMRESGLSDEARADLEKK